MPVKIAAMIPKMSIARESSSHEFDATNSLWRRINASQTQTMSQWSPKPKAVVVEAQNERPDGMVNVELARTIQLTVMSSRNWPIC